MNQLEDRLQVRRLEIGLSRSQLAVAAGCRIGAIQALEQGAPSDDWPLRLVRGLAAALDGRSSN